MEPSETLPPPSPYSQPFLVEDEAGKAVGGFALGKPELTPGTPENTMFLESAGARVDTGLLGFFDKVDYTTNLEPNKYPPVRNLLQAYGNDAKSLKRAATESAIRIKHDSEYFIAAVGDDLRSIVAAQRDAGNYGFSMSDITDEDLIAMARGKGVAENVIQMYLSSDKNPLKEYGIDLRDRVRDGMNRFHPLYVRGREVAEDIEGTIVLAEDDHKKAQDIRAYQFYKGTSHGQLVKDFGNALYMLGEAVFATAGNVGGGAIEAAAGTSDLGLSDKYLVNPELRQKAETIARRAEAVARSGLYDRIKLARTAEDRMVHAEAFAMNPETQQLIIDMKALQDDGAFVPASRFNKLYSVFDGAVRGTQELHRMFGGSVDPGSVFFGLEYTIDKSGLGASVLGGEFVSYMLKSGKRYQTLSDQEVLEHGRLIEENWFQAGANQEAGGIERLYRAAGMEDSALAAARLTNLGVSEKASYAIDIPSLAMVGLGMVGKGARAAKTAVISETLVNRATTIGQEILAAAPDLALADSAVGQAVGNLKKQFGMLGIEISDNEVLALAMSDNLASPEARAVLKTGATEVSVIRKEVGNVMAQNKDLRVKTKQLLAEAKAAAADVKVAPVGRPAVVAGTAATVVGKPAAFAGNFLDNLGNVLLGLPPEGMKGLSALEGKILRQGIKVTGRTAAVGAVFTGYELLTEGYEGATATISKLLNYSVNAAAFGFGAKVVGPALNRSGRLLASTAEEIKTGKRMGTSVFEEAAKRLEDRAKALQKAGDAKGAGVAAADANMLRYLRNNGFEEALIGTAIVSYQGAHGVAVGSALAYGNSRDALGTGAGFGFGGAMVAGAAVRLSAAMPSGVKAGREMTLLANTMQVLSKKTPEQKAQFFEAMANEGLVDANTGQFKSKDGVMKFLDGYLLLETGTMGNWEFVKPGAMMGRTVGMQYAGINAEAIQKLAGDLYPQDPQMAARYAEALIERVNFQNNQRAMVAGVNELLIRNERHGAKYQQKIEAIKKQIADKEAEYAKSGLPGTPKNKEYAALKSQISGYETRLEVIAKEREALTSRLTQEKSRLVDRDGIVRRGEAQGLKGKELADFVDIETAKMAEASDPIRPGELRNGKQGTSIRQIADGLYINDGTGKVLIDSNRANSLTMVHEAFEAILRDDSMRAVNPHIVDFLYAPPEKGKRVLSDPNRQLFFEKYMSDLTPELADNYRKGLESAEKHFQSTGDYSLLLPYVQEATAWWLAVIHDARPVGYAPGVSTPNAAMAAPRGRIFANIFDSESKGLVKRKAGDLYNLVMGERPFVEGVAGLADEWNAMMNPEYGWVGQMSRRIIRGRLESNGMFFSDSSDGTVRGYFRDNAQTLKNPVVNDLYEVIARNLGGLKGVRRANVNVLADPNIPEGVKIEWAQQNGFDHLLSDPAQGPRRILTPDEIVQVNQTIHDGIRDALSTVEPGRRGIEVRDEKNGTVYDGKPTPEEIDAIRKSPNIPPGVRENIILGLETMANGVSNAVVRGTYVNVATKQKGVRTEERLRVPRDTGVVSSEKEFIPLFLTLGTSRSLPGGQRASEAYPVARMKVFDVGAAKGNLQAIRNYGMVQKDGSVVIDVTGQAMTPDRFRQLFPTDADYWNAVNVYLTHLKAAGSIDPTSNRPSMPMGMEPSSVVLARAAGHNDVKLGEVIRDTLRNSLGIDARKDLNLLNPSPYDKVMRDMNQTISDFRVDGLGTLRSTGEAYPIDSNVLAWSAANMAPGTWRKLTNAESLRGLAPTDGWSLGAAVAHPNTQFIIAEDTRPLEGRPNATERRYRIYDAQGNLVENSAKTMAEAREAARVKIAVDDANRQIVEAVAEAARSESERQVIPGSIDRRSAQAFSNLLKPSEKVYEAHTLTPERLSRPVPLFRGVSENRLGQSENAIFGKGFYYTPMHGVAEAYASQRGVNAGIEHGMIDLSSKKLLNLEEIDRSSPQFSALVSSLGLDVSASKQAIIQAVSSKYPKTGMFAAGELGNLAKNAGYDGIISNVMSTDMGTYSQVMLFDPVMAPREAVRSPNLAEKELADYRKSKAERASELARKIIKERQIRFVREQNAQVADQKKWEDEAAKLAAREQAASEKEARAAWAEQAAETARREQTARLRLRELENDVGRKFAGEYNQAEQIYLGDPLKVQSAIKVIDATKAGLVKLDEQLSIPMDQIGVEVRTATIVSGLAPLYQKAFTFQKRPISRMPLDVAATRGILPEVSEAFSQRGAKTELAEAQSYILTNALGQVIISEIRARQGQPAARVFTVYSAGGKMSKIAETEDFNEALKKMLADEYKRDAVRRTQARKDAGKELKTEAIVELLKKAEAGKPFAPQYIQRR